MKTQTNLYVDQDIKKILEKKIGKGKLSEYTEDLWRKALAIESQDIDNINQDLLKLEIKKLREKLEDISINLQNKEDILIRIKDQKVLEEEKYLILEKERLESMTTCNQCGNKILDNKKVTTEKGIYHLFCYNFAEHGNLKT